MELEVQKFLRTNTDGLARLGTEFAIKTSRHGECPNLVLLKYDQIESPKDNLMVQDCRGLILDESNNWNVVAYPYSRFFNYGETLCAPIDWMTARVWEKLDGSLITMYHYGDRWHVATSGTADANCKVNGWERTFAELFWATFMAQGGDTDDFNPSFCYMFELCAPENRVVVAHKEPKVYLHGVRSLVDLEEEHPDSWAEDTGMPLPKSYSLYDVGSCLKAADKLSPVDNEGYVICDERFRRIKIKSPAYVALHHAKDRLGSRRSLAEIVRMGEHDEALAYFPEFQEQFKELKTSYDSVVSECLLVWADIKGIQDRKEFALKATKYPFSSALFNMRDGRCTTPQEYMKGITDNAYHRLLGID